MSSMLGMFISGTSGMIPMEGTSVLGTSTSIVGMSKLGTVARGANVVSVSVAGAGAGEGAGARDGAGAPSSPSAAPTSYGTNLRMLSEV